MPTMTIPTNAAELEELISDPAKLDEISKQDGGLKTLVTNYARTVYESDKTIVAQIREETQKVVVEMFKNEQGGHIKRANLDPGHRQSMRPEMKGAAYNHRAPGTKLDNEYEDAADFLRTTWHHAPTLFNSAELGKRIGKIREIQNSYGSTIPADGGFLIPERLRAEILQISLETSVVRSRARVIPMDTLRIPVPMVDSTSNASSVFGGVVCYWTEEGGDLVESSAKFGRVVLEAKKLTGYAEMPNELIADAAGLGAFFGQTFPQALAWYEDLAYLNGTGVGEPLGALTSGNTAAVTVAKETGQPADTIVWENLVKMYSRMLPSSLANAVWVVSPDTFPELATMALSVGTGGSAIWLNNGASGPPMTILGRPVIVSEKAKKLGDAGDVNFIDFGYYLIGDRQAMSAQSSPHYKFANDKTAFRIIQRVDGRPWLQTAITPQNGSTNTLSPFVKLGERA